MLYDGWFFFFVLAGSRLTTGIFVAWNGTTNYAIIAAKSLWKRLEIYSYTRNIWLIANCYWLQLMALATFAYLVKYLLDFSVRKSSASLVIDFCVLYSLELLDHDNERYVKIVFHTKIFGTKTGKQGVWYYWKPISQTDTGIPSPLRVFWGSFSKRKRFSVGPPSEISDTVFKSTHMH